MSTPKQKSWKTTACGVMAFVAALCVAGQALLDGNPETTMNLKDLMTGGLGLAALLGLSFARDNNVSSEDAGAKDSE